MDFRYAGDWTVCYSLHANLTDKVANRACLQDVYRDEELEADEQTNISKGAKY